MAKKVKAVKKVAKKEEKTADPAQSISFGEAVLDIRTALMEIARQAGERYLGVIQKLQELEGRVDTLELPKDVRNDAPKFLAKNGPSFPQLPVKTQEKPLKETDTSDEMDLI